ncbi:succinate dehydrogenase/fumarate reductase iron-sulfur subunit [Achromobacter deleyi]|uniref:succinate dehydrogenase/fumarate reductase iron-sulfur subunit n=1 Tax=Achromobacter deleyi TaxID=1353891 RepID=UPI001491F21A|nr:2Fe-2S iron-sulfur cluster-binding protein [Achromobacter deleyi]QVQ26415.1 succinate dehydrogenase/fumarate reductase iron-sulfur subunit [Achromobacter deleyi]UIP21982.1 2Fe-2S iron-sulfur cluster-binding protein [Achromobacter deleyi]
METDQSTLTVRILRGDAAGEYVTYSVPARENQTVLDVVTEIQRRLEPTLAYRFSCRVGVCGSCAMTVNGKPRWTCRTHVSRVAKDGVIVIEPMRNMPRVKDLVVDMTEFFHKWDKAGARFAGTATRADAPARVNPASRQRKQADAAIECINCGVCYAACDVVEWDKNYLGPAALNRAWTLVNDERHANIAEVIRKATADGGCNSCHTQGSCMTHCPVGLSPTGSIAGLKRRALLQVLKGG